MKTFTAKQMEQWDFFSKIQYAKKEAIIETAKKLKAKGISDGFIQETTGLTLAEIKKR